MARTEKVKELCFRIQEDVKHLAGERDAISFSEVWPNDKTKARLRTIIAWIEQDLDELKAEIDGEGEGN